MVVFNYSGKEVSAKVVYYGPGLSGKTTNLEWIYGKVPETQRGKMVSMKTKTDRTLFFDFLPLSAGEINGFRTRFLLYTVPGQVYYNATRKLVLKGADGVVFVADSDPQLRQANKESFANLEKNLNEYGTSIDQMPIVLQYNKRDLPQALPLEELNADLNPRGLIVVPAVAIRGEGVFETFKEITRLVFQKMHDRFEKTAPRPTSGPPLASSREGGGVKAARPSSAMVKASSAVPMPAAPAPPAGKSPRVPHASDDEVIHLSTIDQILAGRNAPAAAVATADASLPTAAPQVDAPAPVASVAPAEPAVVPLIVPEAVAPAPVVAIPDLMPAAAMSIPRPITTLEAPASATTPPNLSEIFLEPEPAQDSREAVVERPAAGARSGDTVVEHRVLVPVVLPSVACGRIRLVLEVEISEGKVAGASKTS